MTDTAAASALTKLTASQLVAGYLDRQFSPVEVIEAALARAGSEEPTLNAFCLLDPDGALAQARASEQRWQDGRPAGALDGVPVGVKDVFLTRGLPTVRGSHAIDSAGPWDDDAPVVAAVRRNGGVLLGKTTTPELGWKGVTDSPLAGITRNPWDPERTAGGSSGGSSAALAAGVVPLALGTDGGGSIRIPCAMCGNAGIKPTYGRVPAWPPSPFGLLAHLGPMARTVEDVALLLDVLSEPDARDWSALPPPQGSFAANLERGVEGLRVAFSPTLGYVDVDAEVAAAVAAAAAALAELGARVEQVDPGFDDPRQTFDTLWYSGAAKGVADLGDPDPELLDPGLAEVVRMARTWSAQDYVQAAGRRNALGLAMSTFHEDWDLLVTPTLPLPAFEAGREVPAGSADSRWPSWTPFTYPFNLTQQPAASVPCGFTADGLPIGLQIVGPRHGDALVLRAARAYEAAHPQPTLATSGDAE